MQKWVQRVHIGPEEVDETICFGPRGNIHPNHGVELVITAVEPYRRYGRWFTSRQDGAISTRRAAFQITKKPRHVSATPSPHDTPGLAEEADCARGAEVIRWVS